MRSASAQAGFTLIEVLVVCAIIGVLSAISVQIFIEMRVRAYDGRANADIRNVASAEEAYYAENELYVSCSSANDCSQRLPGIPELSSGVTLAVTATTTGFIGTSSHPKGTGIVYEWNSSEGGIAN